MSSFGEILRQKKNWNNKSQKFAANNFVEDKMSLVVLLTLLKYFIANEER